MGLNEKLTEHRIGNIAYLNSQGGEIVCWYPNIYYKKESEFTFDPERGMYYRVEGCYVHPGCFKSPECCYVIAFVKVDTDGLAVRPVGLRPWELSEKDEKDFKGILSYLCTEIENQKGV